ncbi:VanZ family protein [Microbacterium sp. SSM24]|uniref:VanZ family protein n=1 Tax=Microbacterium sp. SSM24 TaxID=2991714 RepID=UPI002225C051|nr:VanZ family protein [Microbacterium sp. SSM24]MCW3492882.1 VanZ family protein [Microbacterium sp. SSM24]
MDDRLLLGGFAIALGFAAGVILFVPFVAVSYRRRGGLTFGRFTLWAAALVYFMAIWTHTLLPLPDPQAMVCAGTNTELFAFVDDLRGVASRPTTALTDPAALQLLLNVLLFVPLGFFVRVLGGRGVVVATLTGLGVSGFVEFTQLTGVWGLYPCAYRVFDVDDLLTNTIGAVVGSLLGLAVPRRHRGMVRSPDAYLPRPVTRSRRLLVMVCDAVGAWLVSLAVGVAFQIALAALGADVEVRDGSAATTVASTAGIAVWFVVVLVTGRTVGDLAVQLRYEGGVLPEGLARTLRFAGGIGGFLVLFALPGAWDLIGWLYAVASIVLVFTTRDARGLPGLVSGQRVVDAREPIDPDTPPRRPAAHWR